jgi:hypothetical protein
MPFTSARTGFGLAAPVAVLVVVSSCTFPPVPQASLAPRPSGVLSETSIANPYGHSAYDVVARLRPSVVALNSGQLFEPSVYVDGLRVGGVSALQLLPADGLVDVRFLSASEAFSLYGWQAGRGGAIVLTTKRGQRSP